jgi:hypothetical protein
MSSVQPATPATEPKATMCYACRIRKATRWIRSTSQFFSAPRCYSCCVELQRWFMSKGVDDVQIEVIGEPINASVVGGTMEAAS